MERRHTLLVAALATTSLMATGAFAQGYGPWFGARMGPGMMYGNGRAAIIDQNDDGRISSEEAAASAEEVFTAMDADDDGQITKDEYMAVRMGPGWGWNTERQAAMQANKEARFGEMDADKNGSVSKVEFLATAQTHFKAADQDGDGQVNPWEYRRGRWL
ncbi:EF-hand domain-containing protein [Neorhizobium sp. LjRoot104]|uniref:EF-hand domain-containing protein n=1 Tax=Neorhizobium sp. LjRoot104 TaxID=3342254 RepID=UPI003ECDD42B